MKNKLKKVSSIILESEEAPQDPRFNDSQYGSDDLQSSGGGRVQYYPEGDKLLNWMKINHCERLIVQTQILIAPGYQYRVVKAIVTNFHQPQSTLLLLVAAAISEDWKKLYQFALKNNYRFLSYGDGSLLFLNNSNR